MKKISIIIAILMLAVVAETADRNSAYDRDSMIYNQGVQAGQQSGYQAGYQAGYQSGFRDGQTSASQQHQGYSSDSDGICTSGRYGNGYNNDNGGVYTSGRYGNGYNRAGADNPIMQKAGEVAGRVVDEGLSRLLNR